MAVSTQEEAGASPDRSTSKILLLIAPLLISFLASLPCGAQGISSEQSCPRPSAGSSVVNPPELQSHNGTLELTLHMRYQRTQPSEGPPRYCYVTDDGLESPTLRVLPGDELIIHLHNELPQLPIRRPENHEMRPANAGEDCIASEMNASVTNLHFHGMTVPPVCHQDDVLHTAIPAGSSYNYRLTIPRDESPGLYWYHPHPHGFTERQIQGGASGVIIVGGMERLFPEVASLPQRVIVLRDQQRIGPEAASEKVPTWDISANFVPITYPLSVPAVIHVRPAEKEYWQVVNAGADTIFNLRVLVNSVAQPLRILAIDASPTEANAGPLTQDTILLPPGARAEFVVATPSAGQSEQLVTEAWDTGPAGDNDTKRTIASIVSSGDSKPTLPTSRDGRRALPSVLPASEEAATVTQRHLYFSQRSSNPQDPDNFVLYFITVEGQNPSPYKMGSLPNIVVHEGAVEDWTIENRSPEDHVFHIHQLHFKVLEVSGKPTDEATLRDTIDIPYWRGSGPYPSVKLRMNFSDPNLVGTFLYHCHILKHEDMGMMGAIQVLPRSAR